MDIVLEPTKTVRVMGLIAIFLILNHMALRILELYSHFDCASGLFHYYCRMFTVNAEGMVPTMYSTVALLFCSSLLSVIGITKRKLGTKYGLYWLGLALIFLFLAMDEALEIHEQFAGPVRSALNITSGPFYFAWVIPYGIALIIFIAVYLKFLVELSEKTRILFISAGGIYVLGAMGFELLGGNQSSLSGQATLTYFALSTTEEIFEMGGILVFVYALLSYVKTEHPDLKISITSR